MGDQEWDQGTKRLGRPGDQEEEQGSRGAGEQLDAGEQGSLQCKLPPCPLAPLPPCLFPMSQSPPSRPSPSPLQGQFINSRYWEKLGGLGY
ncbi:MAG: hypothetical protein Fur0025_34130 [Oscillatoriaceae cyanobacterium]